MDIDSLTNDNLMSTDFAQPEKTAFLKQAIRHKSAKTVFLAPGLPANAVWMTDVSAMDRRSVKAQLAGRGDLRATWWHFNCYLHSRLHPGVSLEQQMYTFHARHHALTFARLEIAAMFWRIFDTVKQQGPIAGVRCAIAEVQGPLGERP